MGLTCVLCLVAFQGHQPTAAYDQPVEGVTDRPHPASVIYKGESMCDAHFNVVRGHPRLGPIYEQGA